MLLRDSPILTADCQQIINELYADFRPTRAKISIYFQTLQVNSFIHKARYFNGLDGDRDRSLSFAKKISKKSADNFHLFTSIRDCLAGISGNSSTVPIPLTRNLWYR